MAVRQIQFPIVYKQNQNSDSSGYGNIQSLEDFRKDGSSAASGDGSQSQGGGQSQGGQSQGGDGGDGGGGDGGDGLTND